MMRTTCIGIGLGVFLILLGACEEPDPSTKSRSDQKKDVREEENERSGPVEYEVQVEQEEICSLGRVLVNGFPVDRWGGRAVHQEYDFPINTALVGEGNVLTVENEPCFSGGQETLSTGSIKMMVRVKGAENKWTTGGHITEAEIDSTYRAWKKKARRQWQEYRRGGAVLDSMRAWASRNPLTVTTTFDNEAGPDFSRVFEEAPRLEDTPSTRKRLKDYAMHLRDLMAEKDTSALFEEFRPAIEARYRSGTTRTRSEFMEANRQAVVVEGAVLDFTRSDLRMQQWAGWRMWQVWRDGAINRALFQDSSGGGLGTMYMAELDGELKVVRY